MLRKYYFLEIYVPNDRKNISMSVILFSSIQLMLLGMIFCRFEFLTIIFSPLNKFLITLLPKYCVRHYLVKFPDHSLMPN